jgi:hypothetical protein
VAIARQPQLLSGGDEALDVADNMLLGERGGGDRTDLPQKVDHAAAR